MRALLLSAGMGTRLRPLTDNIPKCLVPIHGRPLLDYWLDTLVNGGVKEILINTHYLSPLVVDYVNKSTWSSYVTCVYEDSLLGTGGTILKNREFFQDEDFIVAHADNLTIFDLGNFTACHMARSKDIELTMMIFESPDPRSCGIVELDEKGTVQSFHEKVAFPPGNLANAAVYILTPTVCDFISSIGRAEIDFSTEVIPHFLGRITTFLNSSYHRDIGTIQSWTDAHTDFPATSAAPINGAAWASTANSINVSIANSGLNSVYRALTNKNTTD